MRAVKSSGLINLENLHLIVRQHHITTSKKNLGLFPGKNFADLEEVRCVSEDDKQSSVGRPRTCLFCLFPREMYDNKVTFFPTGFMTLFSKSIQKKSFKGALKLCHSFVLLFSRRPLLYKHTVLSGDYMVQKSKRRYEFYFFYDPVIDAVDAVIFEFHGRTSGS